MNVVSPGRNSLSCLRISISCSLGLSFSRRIWSRRRSFSRAIAALSSCSCRISRCLASSASIPCGPRKAIHPYAPSNPTATMYPPLRNPRLTKTVKLLYRTDSEKIPVACYIFWYGRMREDIHEAEPRRRLSCPKCGSSDIRRSKSEGLFSGLARMFGRWPFRCRSCRVKFYRSAEPPEYLH
jgi:hypothetical protein